MANKFGTARILGDFTAEVTPQERVNLEMLRAVESMGRRLERTENERDRLAARLAQIEAAGAIDEKTGKFYLPVVVNHKQPPAAATQPRWMLGMTLASSALALFAVGFSIFHAPAGIPQLTPQQLAALDALAGPMRTVDATGNGWKKVDEDEGVDMSANTPAKPASADSMPPQPVPSLAEARLPTHMYAENFGPALPQAEASDGWRVAATHDVNVSKVPAIAPKGDTENAPKGDTENAPKAEADIAPAAGGDNETASAPATPAPKIAETKKPAAPRPLDLAPAQAADDTQSADKAPEKAADASDNKEAKASGIDINPDPALSPQLQELERRAFAGAPEAQHDLATIYAAGKSVTQDYKRAAYWFYKAADGGIANADYNLGVMFQEGMGVHKDVNKALGWYEKAAQLGHPEAMYNLGIAYVEGVGTQRNIDRGVSYFKKAANAGVAQAAYNLGVLYESNFVGPINLAKAAEWYQVAADEGHTQAKDAVVRLRQQIAVSTKASDQGAKAAAQVEPAAGAKSDEEVGEGDASPAGEASGNDPLLLSRVQSALIAHGDINGVATGVMDDQTANAIRTWQKKLNLPVTGQPTLDLLNKIPSATTDK